MRSSLAQDYHMALIAVERNGLGEAVMTELRVHSDYPNVYCSHGAPGWVTTDMSRDRALADLRELVDNQSDLFASHRLLQECRTFVRDRQGQVRGRAGRARRHGDGHGHRAGGPRRAPHPRCRRSGQKRGGVGGSCAVSS